MSDVIRVWPAPELRQTFAQWAVAQAPPLRTVSAHEFGVPAELYAEMPEELLVGALVDDQDYVPAVAEPAPAAEIMGEAEATFGAPHGREPTREEAAALSRRANERTAAEGTAAWGQAEGPAVRQVVCRAEGCGQPFAGMRELRAHRRDAHPKPAGEG